MCLQGAWQIKAPRRLPWGLEQLRALICIPVERGAPSSPHPWQPLIWFDVSFSLLPRQETLYPPLLRRLLAPTLCVVGMKGGPASRAELAGGLACELVKGLALGAG